MPYIKEAQKQRFREPIAKLMEQMQGLHGITPGELNFIFTTIGLIYVNGNGMNYANCSDVVASLECAKLEFYRRAVAPYEDRKAEENGDVYRAFAPVKG